MPEPMSSQEALRRLLFALLEQPSSRSRTRILKRAVDLEAALREQGVPHPHDVLEVLGQFSLSGRMTKDPDKRTLLSSFYDSLS